MGDSPPSSNINPLIVLIMETKIVNSWSFVAFVISNGGKAFVAPFVNKEREKDNLQVVQRESGSYKLCRVGESSWNEIDLGI